MFTNCYKTQRATRLYCASVKQSNLTDQPAIVIHSLDISFFKQNVDCKVYVGEKVKQLITFGKHALLILGRKINKELIRFLGWQKKKKQCKKFV